jgi:acetate kinase
MVEVKSALIVNMGSSSLKWVVLEPRSEQLIQQGEARWTAAAGQRHADELVAALRQVPRIDAVGHRVVHGGSAFREARVIDVDALDQLKELAELAPLHNPAAVAGIEAAIAAFPDVPQVAAFDTAFHSTIGPVAHTYPLPWDWTTRWGLRRFGFHGLSVSYAVDRSRELLGDVPRRMVVCHLGAGCSVTAVGEGRSIETSMGFTPLEGVMMAQRSGSIDPGLLLYLLRRGVLRTDELDRGLNAESGLLGVSGISSDMREVLAAAAGGHERAQLAIDMFVHRIAASIAAMLPALGGLDALVFTGGIGEHSALTRQRVCATLGWLGLTLDSEANEAATSDGQVSTSDSSVRVLVIAAREDLSVLRQLSAVLWWT